MFKYLTVFAATIVPLACYGKCDSEFGGIGVSYWHDGENVIIEEVFKDYPAHKSGIRTGDIIPNLGPESMRGDVDSYLSVKVIRQGKSFPVKIKRVKICITKEKGEKENVYD